MARGDQIQKLGVVRVEMNDANEADDGPHNGVSAATWQQALGISGAILLTSTIAARASSGAHNDSGKDENDVSDPKGRVHSVNVVADFLVQVRQATAAVVVVVIEEFFRLGKHRRVVMNLLERPTHLKVARAQKSRKGTSQGLVDGSLREIGSDNPNENERELRPSQAAKARLAFEHCWVILDSSWLCHNR